MPRWLINEDRLKKQQEKNTKRRSTIVIILSNKNVFKQLMAGVLQFERVVNKVEKFWDAGPGLVCFKCCGIEHERLGGCKNRPEKCVLCAREHQASEDQYSINEYSKKT